MRTNPFFFQAGSFLRKAWLVWIGALSMITTVFLVIVWLKTSKQPITISVVIDWSTQKGVKSLSVVKNPNTLSRLPLVTGTSIVSPMGCQA